MARSASPASWDSLITIRLLLSGEPTGSTRGIASTKSWASRPSRCGASSRNTRNMRAAPSAPPRWTPMACWRAATSTGGVTLKMVGQSGDSPVPGAGNYASKHVAASATGTGEFVLRALATRAIAERVEGGASLEEAVEAVLRRMGVDFDADVGFMPSTIAVRRLPGIARVTCRTHSSRARPGWFRSCGHRRLQERLKNPRFDARGHLHAELDVLLIERADRPGLWQSVTGSQDPGESLAETAVREVFEETGSTARHYGIDDSEYLQRLRDLRHLEASLRAGHHAQHGARLRIAGPRKTRSEARARRALECRWISWRRRRRRYFPGAIRKAILMLPEKDALHGSRVSPP